MTTDPTASGCDMALCHLKPYHAYDQVQCTGNPRTSYAYPYPMNVLSSRCSSDVVIGGRA